MAKEAKERGDPMVRLLVTAPNEMVAHLWADALGQDGIRSMTRPASFSALYTGFSLAQYEVWVLTSQVEKANEILAPLLEDD